MLFLNFNYLYITYTAKSQIDKSIKKNFSFNYADIKHNKNVGSPKFVFFTTFETH